MKTLSSIFLPMFLAGVLWAGPEKPYHQLALMDLDEMTIYVQKKIEASAQGDSEPLRQALQTVLSRPDEDFMVDKVLGPIRQALEERDLWEETLGSLVDESLSVLKKPAKIPAPMQVTYSVFLSNVVSQMKPHATEKGFERKALEKIRDADISLTKEMKADRQLRMMKDSLSPSVQAEQALGKTKK